MPWQMKTKRAVRKWARSMKRPSAMVPVPRRMTPAGQHLFTRIASSNQGASNALPILIQTDSLTGRPNFTNTVNSGQNLALQFRLDQVDLYLNGSLSSTFAVPNYTEFTNLFDEYCIKKVEVMVLPSYASAGPSASVASWIPWVVHATDYDDTSSTGATSLMQYTGAKFTQLLGSVGQANAVPIRTVKPRPKLEILTAAGGNGVFHQDKDVWVVSANPTCPHLGFKMSLDDSYSGGTTGTVVCGLNIVCKYTIACRDVV